MLEKANVVVVIKVGAYIHGLLILLWVHIIKYCILTIPLFPLTSSVCISQLHTNHSCINTAPAVIAHCTPLVIDAHLHSTLILIWTSHQTNSTIGTVATGNHCWEIILALYKIFCPERCFCSLIKKAPQNATPVQTVLQTLTSYSCILWVTTWTADSSASRAINQVVLTTSAANIVQVDCASTSTKMGSTESHCICKNKGIHHNDCRSRTDSESYSTSTQTEL